MNGTPHLLLSQMLIRIEHDSRPFLDDLLTLPPLLAGELEKVEVVFRVLRSMMRVKDEELRCW